MQQHSLHPGRMQARQFTTRMLTTFLERIQGELLDLRTANRGMQIVVQPGTPGHTEKGGGQTLQLASAQGFRTTGELMPTIEQTVDVLLQITLALADRLGVAKQEQNPRPRFEIAAGNVVQQPIEQLDRCGFVAMDARRQQQVLAIVTSLGRAHFEGALAEPAHAYAVDSQLGLLCRFATGQGQFKQFAEGEHGLFLSDGGRNQDHVRDHHRRRRQPVPFPAAG
ncbi:hypothetical protein D3C84_634640 [compost metagenome]